MTDERWFKAQSFEIDGIFITGRFVEIHPPEESMTQTDYIEAFKAECAEQMKLSYRKNRDYAGEGNAFANFDLIEVLTAGRITSEMGLLVRMSDKLQRYANLLFKDPDVSGETRADTLRDLSIYAKIAKIMADRKADDDLGTRVRPREIKPGDRFTCSTCNDHEFVASSFTQFHNGTAVTDEDGTTHMLANCRRVS